MVALPDWGSPEAYTFVEDLAPAELAWEWLRRNPDYRRDYASLIEAGHERDAVSEPICAHWGLRFPD